MNRAIPSGLIFMFVVTAFCEAQTIGKNLPAVINKNSRYLFYQHGAVVTLLGDNAINQSVPEWGPYQYSAILDSLSRRNFNVISERRQEGIADSVYANKIAAQIDSLLNAGVKVRNILILGASAGWNIALQVSAIVKNKKMKFAMMGGCWPQTYKDYEHFNLYGRFLSVIESSDPHGTCAKVFETRKQISDFTEYKLNTGLSHGFIYKGHREWIDPVVSWFEKR